MPKHRRSLLTITIMMTLNRSEELALHLHAARYDGVTREEVKEVLLQAAIYRGVPAANSALLLVKSVFDEHDNAAG